MLTEVSAKQNTIYMVIHCGLFKLLFVFKWFANLLTISFGAQFDAGSCWMNHKPYLKSARARAIVLFFVSTALHCGALDAE